MNQQSRNEWASIQGMVIKERHSQSPRVPVVFPTLVGFDPASMPSSPHAYRSAFYGSPHRSGIGIIGGTRLRTRWAPPQRAEIRSSQNPDNQEHLFPPPSTVCAGFGSDHSTLFTQFFPHKTNSFRIQLLSFFETIFACFVCIFSRFYFEPQWSLEQCQLFFAGVF